MILSMLLAYLCTQGCSPLHRHNLKREQFFFFWVIERNKFFQGAISNNKRIAIATILKPTRKIQPFGTIRKDPLFFSLFRNNKPKLDKIKSSRKPRLFIKQRNVCSMLTTNKWFCFFSLVPNLPLDHRTRRGFWRANL